MRWSRSQRCRRRRCGGSRCRAGSRRGSRSGSRRRSRAPRRRSRRCGRRGARASGWRLWTISSVSWREVERLPGLDAAFAGGERQQRVDQPLLLAGELQRLLAGRAQGLGVGVRVGERHLQQRALAGERGAQLMGGVGDELALGLERRLQPSEQVVERATELGELVIGPVEAEPAVQIGGRDLLGRRRHRAQRPQEPARPATMRRAPRRRSPPARAGTARG